MTTPFERIAECHPALRKAAAAAADYWRPDPVPSTVGLGELGGVLVDAEPPVPDDALVKIAAFVEEVLATDGADANAVATGFLEAICNRSAHRPSSVERIVERLGARALAYIRAWDQFTGVKTPGVPGGAG